MNDTSTLLWGLLFGSIGIGYFVYGKRQGNKVTLLSGLALMLYPYIVTNTFALIGMGLLLMLLPRLIRL